MNPVIVVSALELLIKSAFRIYEQVIADKAIADSADIARMRKEMEKLLRQINDLK